MTDAKLWDRIAPKYARDPIRDPDAYEYTLGRTLSYLGADDHVLEIGCGTGSTALRIAPSVSHIEATDISAGMLKIAAERKAEATAMNATFTALSAERAARLPGPFQAVLAFNLLHLVRDPEALMADVFWQLPSGGYFISKTPGLGDPSVGLKRFAFKMLIPLLKLVGKAPSRVHFFTHAGLDTMVKDAGFEIVESGNFPAISRYIVARKR